MLLTRYRVTHKPTGKKVFMNTTSPALAMFYTRPYFIGMGILPGEDVSDDDFEVRVIRTLQSVD